jgi:hypothetical protein
MFYYHKADFQRNSKSIKPAYTEKHCKSVPITVTCLLSGYRVKAFPGVQYGIRIQECGILFSLRHSRIMKFNFLQLYLSTLEFLYHIWFSVLRWSLVWLLQSIARLLYNYSRLSFRCEWFSQPTSLCQSYVKLVSLLDFKEQRNVIFAYRLK